MKQYLRAVSDSVWQCHAVPSKRRYYHEQWITGVQRAEQTGTVGADGGAVSGQRTERTAVVPGARRECLVLLQVAAEGLCRSPGSTGAQQYPSELVPKAAVPALSISKQFQNSGFFDIMSAE